MLLPGEKRKGKKMIDTLIKIYLDYVNNYLTIERMAEDYGTSESQMQYMISMGKYYHNKGV